MPGPASGSRISPVPSTIREARTAGYDSIRWLTPITINIDQFKDLPRVSSDQLLFWTGSNERLSAKFNQVFPCSGGEIWLPGSAKGLLHSRSKLLPENGAGGPRKRLQSPCGTV